MKNTSKEEKRLAGCAIVGFIIMFSIGIMLLILTMMILTSIIKGIGF